MAATLPIMVQVGIIYLILRFTFAVSNVVVRLSTLHSPKKKSDETGPEGSTSETAQLAETVEGEGENGAEKTEPAALPESTTED